MNKLKVYLMLLRPFTLLAPLIVSCSVMVASIVYNGNTDLSLMQIILTILAASLCFAFLNGASNALNQATDWREDKISKPYRPIPQGIASVRDAYTLSFVMYIIALVFSLTINLLFSMFVFLIAAFSITYSLSPRMKKYLFVNQLWVALPRGFLAILGSWSAFADPFQHLPLAIGSIAALFLVGGTTTKDILDAEADRNVGTKTLVNMFGVKKAAFFSLFFMGSAFILIIPLILLQVIEPYFYPLSLLILLSIAIFWFMHQKHKNERCENTTAWTLMYATYFLFALSFAVLTISFSF